MNDKNLMKKISLNRNISSNFFPSQNRYSNLNQDNPIRKSNLCLLGRMTVMSSESNYNLGTENYNNIITNSRMTNSFGDMTDEKLKDFYEFGDDF